VKKFVHVVTVRSWLNFLLLLGLAAQAHAAGFAPAHTHARLLLGNETARPGDTVMAALQLKMDQGWHTYWKNPGASGMATEIAWKLPPGITAGESRWPTPQKLTEETFTTYIYSNEVVLLIPLHLAKDLRPGRMEVSGEASWLECELQCIKQSQTVQAVFEVGLDRKPSTNAVLIEAAEQKIPGPISGEAKATARWEGPPKQDSRFALLEWKGASQGFADFFPYTNEQFEVQGAVERLTAPAGEIRIRKEVKKLSGDWPRSLSGLIVEAAPDGLVGYDCTLSLGQAAAISGTSLALMLVYALLGGLILNIMPCVLPVIALKILGFVNQSREEPRRVRQLGLYYGLGVWVSFLALAALVIGLKAAGHTAAWGMQFGNPQFVVLLTILVTLVALNLFGLFEIAPGGGVMDAAGELASRHGGAGAFFNGALATILATPCTAPFLATALGFAFVQPPAIIVLVFSTVALGLALPYLLLTWNPAWLKFLPKPGLWMERFKIAMGFPMLATAFWLFSLVPIHYGDRAWWLGVFLVALAFAAWIFGVFVQRGRQRRAAALTIALGLVLAAYAFVLEGQLGWRRPVPATNGATAALAIDPNGVPWQPWSESAVTEARAQGKPVLVDFTAKWCLTCNTLVKPVLESETVRNKIRETHAAALLGDYTSFPANITAELAKHGRAGVPLVLVFPAKISAEPIVLPQALTPGQVAAALEQAK
jgi:thiol:disulfide interchange protein